MVELFPWNIELCGLTHFSPSIAFYMESSHLICIASQISGFYMTSNTGLKWLKVGLFRTKYEIGKGNTQYIIHIQSLLFKLSMLRITHSNFAFNKIIPQMKSAFHFSSKYFIFTVKLNLSLSRTKLILLTVISEHLQRCIQNLVKYIKWSF